LIIGHERAARTIASFRDFGVVDDRLEQARKLAAEARQQARIKSAIDAVGKVAKAATLVRKAEVLLAGGEATSWLSVDGSQSTDPNERNDVVTALRDLGYSESEIETVLIELPRGGTGDNRGTEIATLVTEIRAVVAGDATPPYRRIGATIRHRRHQRERFRLRALAFYAICRDVARLGT
jgi:hypothetical protein